MRNRNRHPRRPDSNAITRSEVNMKLRSKRFRQIIGMAAALSLGAQFASAMDRPSKGWEDYWWQTRLGAPLNHDQPFSHLDEINGATHKAECAPVTKAILNALHQYADFSSKFSKRGNEQGAGDALLIQQSLRHDIFQEMSPTSICYDAAVRTYFLGSVYVAMPDFVHLSSKWERNPNGSTVPYQTLSPEDIEFMMGKLMTASALLNKNLIQFLTHDKRTELGG